MWNCSETPGATEGNNKTEGKLGPIYVVLFIYFLMHPLNVLCGTAVFCFFTF